MWKKIGYLLSGVALLGALFSVALPIIVYYQRIQDSATLLHYLGYQHSAGWLVSIVGLLWISGKAIFSSPPPPYEMLSRKNLTVLVSVLLFLNISHFVQGHPLALPPLLHSVFNALNVGVAFGLTSMALWKPAYPRTLIVLLLMYASYFTNGVLLIALRLNPELSLGRVLSQPENSYIVWILGFVLFGGVFAFAALGKRQSEAEILLEGINKLKKLRSASKNKEDALKNIEIAKLVLDTFVKPPPPPPQPGSLVTVSMDRALGDFENKLKGDLQKAKEEYLRKAEDLKRQEEEIQRLLAQQQVAAGDGKEGKDAKGDKGEGAPPGGPPKPEPASGQA